MDENRISGTAKNISGKVEEGFGRVTGDTELRLQELRNRSGELPKTCTAKHVMLRPTWQGLRGTLQHHLRNCSGTLSKLNPTRLPLLRSELAGYWEECTAPCSRGKRKTISPWPDGPGYSR